MDTVDMYINLVLSLPDSKDYIYYDKSENQWCVTTEWLVGTFAGRAFYGKTKREAMSKVIDYFNKHINHDSIVGLTVTQSGWPDINKVKSYISQEKGE